MSTRTGQMIGIAGLMVLLGLPALASASVSVTGRVSGTDGNGIAAVVLDFLLPGSQTVVASATTGADGGYQATIASGTYDVRVTALPASGFVAQTIFGRSIVADTTLDIVLVRAGDTVTFSGHVMLADLTPLANAGIALCAVPIGSQSCTSSTSGADGAFAVHVGIGTYSLRVSRSLPPSVAAVAYYSLDLGERLLDVDVQEDITITVPPTRTVRGLVVDATDTPVADAVVRGNVTDDALGISSGDYVTTAADGLFELHLFSGSGTIDVTPSASSGLAAIAVGIDITGDVDGLTIHLADPSSTYQGSVFYRDDTPVPSPAIGLCGSSCTFYTGNPTGEFSVATPPGDFYASVSGNDPVEFAHWYYALGFRHIDGVVTETIHLPDRRLSVSAIDVDGYPVFGVELIVNATSPDGGFGQSVAFTPATGQINLIVFPGTAEVQITPPPTSGLAPFTTTIPIADDRSLALLLQFLVDHVAQVVSPGATVGTDPEGDGATPNDPIETTLTTPTGGFVEIREGEITGTAPTGFQFLTQEVQITAPPSTPDDPMTITFRIDASRIPPENDAATIDIFKDGVLVEPCPVTGVLDPCVVYRARLDDGDVMLVVRTSTASTWNPARRLPPPVPTKDELACMKKADGAISKLTAAKLGCLLKCAKAARKGQLPFAECMPPYAGATAACMGEVGKGAAAKAVAAIVKGCAKACPPCSTACGGAAALERVRAAVTRTDTVASAALCSPGADKSQAKCEDATVKAVGKLSGALRKCFAKCRQRAFKGELSSAACGGTSQPSTDPETLQCENTARQKTLQAFGNACLLPGAVPACFGDRDDGFAWLEIGAPLASIDRVDLWCAP